MSRADDSRVTGPSGGILSASTRSVERALREKRDLSQMEIPGYQMGPLFLDPEGADFTRWINHFKGEVYRNWMIPEPARLGRADLHIHSAASDGVAGIDEILRHVQEATDLDFIPHPDHERHDSPLSPTALAPTPGPPLLVLFLGGVPEGWTSIASWFRPSRSTPGPTGIKNVSHSGPCGRRASAVAGVRGSAARTTSRPLSHTASPSW